MRRSVLSRQEHRRRRPNQQITDFYRRGDVVQLVRTLPCHGRGRGFESRRPRHFFQENIHLSTGPSVTGSDIAT
jgi:hypothetical protein